MYTLPTNLSEDISYFGSLIDDFKSGRLEPVKFKATRVPMGIYEQRKDGTYMVRIRCSGGYISPKQLRNVAEIARKHNSSLLHITTRQEIQIQNVDLPDALLILQDLKETGLTSKGGGGNTVRNILVSIDSGVAVNEVFDVTDYATNLTTKLIAEPDSFNLPRKFKIAFSNTEEDKGFAAFNDLGFIAKIKDGKRGFKVYLGGSLASKPTVGYELYDFAPQEDIYYITDAAKKLFSRYGNRKNKHKARLRYVFYKLGKEEVFRLFFEILNEVKQQADINYIHTEHPLISYTPAFAPEKISDPDFLKWKSRYATSQRQKGYFSIIIPFENGNSIPEKLIRLADFLSLFGEDVLRFSMRQDIHLRNIPEAYLGNLYLLLKDLGVKLHLPVLINSVVSCTGADTCRLGICLTKGASDALQRKLETCNLDLDKLSDLRINISGCPNSCGQQMAADLGFYGKVSRNDRMYPAYHIVAGASIGAEPKLAEIVGEISAHDLPVFSTELFSIYLSKKEMFKSFSAYIQGEGKDDIQALTQKFKNIPSFSDDKNYYYDWGSDHVFSLAAKGVGECSSGLFDMIEVDLKTIQDITSKLQTVIEKSTENELLHKLIFASSRMLLITRGAEPKSIADAYNFFIEKFIDFKIINEIFRDVVELGRDTTNADFSVFRKIIIELSESVVKLYEGMDDSLQFKFQESLSMEKKSPSDQPASNRKKDFRGVACPMNFVKTKIELATLASGDILEILLDDGAPIENVPGSIRGEGHVVLSQNKIDDYWKVHIKKA